MTLTKYNKNRGLPTLFESLFNDDVFRTFPDFIATNHMNKGIPAVNMKEANDSYGVEIAAPGLSKDDLSISLEDGLLTISSENKSEKNEDSEGYTLREFSYNSFSRSFRLPEDVDEESISAKYENGVLNLEIPKMEVAKKKSPKMIEVL